MVNVNIGRQYSLPIGSRRTNRFPIHGYWPVSIIGLLFVCSIGLLINSLMKGSADGSLASLTIVEEEAFKRLGLLQGQLMRNIQHMAALNPKAFRWGFVPFDSIFILIQLAWIIRIVKNEYVSKPLTRGILDGNLLGQYESLPINRQSEATQQIGADRVNVLRDWIELRGSWS